MTRATKPPIGFVPSWPKLLTEPKTENRDLIVVPAGPVIGSTEERYADRAEKKE